MAPEIDGFENLELIGRGGFGEVYRAWQPEFGRWVAVKVLPRPPDDDAQNRAQREALAMGSLSGHPNIVTIYTAGTSTDGAPYFVMPWLGSGSLGDRVETTGPVGSADAVALSIKVAGALHTAHTAGIIHRDVKPDNVLFSDFGEPQLADFGIALVAGSQHTTGSSVTTTILYAAPEVLGGEPPTYASDVYALAATAYAAVTGRPAFAATGDANLASTIARVATQPVSRPPQITSDAVWGVLERAMAKNPEERQHSAYEFGAALQRAQRLSGTAITPMTIPGEGPDSGLQTLAVDVPLPLVPDDRKAATVKLGAERDLAQPREVSTQAPSRRDVPWYAWVGLLAVVLALFGGVAYAINQSAKSDETQAPSPGPSTITSPGAATSSLATTTTPAPTTTTAPATTTTAEAPESSLVGLTDDDPSHWAPSGFEADQTFQLRVFSVDSWELVDGFPVTMNGCDTRQLRVHWRALSSSIRPAIASYWPDALGPVTPDQIGDPATEGTMILNSCEQPAFQLLPSPGTLANLTLEVSVFDPAA